MWRKNVLSNTLRLRFSMSLRKRMPPTWVCYGFYSLLFSTMIFHSLIQKFNWFKWPCIQTQFFHSFRLAWFLIRATPLPLIQSQCLFRASFFFFISSNKRHQSVFHFRDLCTENDSFISISLSLLRHNKNEDENENGARQIVAKVKEKKNKRDEKNDNGNQIMSVVQANDNAVQEIGNHSKVWRIKSEQSHHKHYQQIGFENAPQTWAVRCGLWAVWYTNNWHNTKLDYQTACWHRYSKHRKIFAISIVFASLRRHNIRAK